MNTANMYASETNGLINGTEYHVNNQANAHPEVTYVYWTTPGLKITRLRLLTDRYVPFWDVSYCDGILDGYHVTVTLPFSQLPKRGVVGEILKYAKADGVFAKGTGILDCISRLW